ncbi:uncharacterized protein LOC111903851 isoform X1 [Lactuca sativa]|uniref:uncharacterized protein LOC111903851 isoform X1 n=2 Tax=Lactuca sativa TaxID=4236 RepID=UPI001C693D1E|nr:uncharacterized protein LOC111903851 isoform X1 [Lactuca sativa]XP_042754629.1 uncharacterized protein LOC111903851 isoform X1 [Lactuca sativa]XP_042754630.1 uncharacterized protein LOC111903851 isoform X1 [Lactuca sativa]
MNINYDCDRDSGSVLCQLDCDSYYILLLLLYQAPSMEDYMLIKSHLSLDLDDQLMNSQTFVMKMVENVEDPYSVCIEKDVDIEKGKSETPGINQETVGDLKNEEGQMLLMNHNLILPKFSIREAPRMRKYKRSSSFNSRKVLLLFSVLSSLGTIILIYLTLRVKQIGDW